MVEEKNSDIKSIKLVFPNGAPPPKKLNRECRKALEDLSKTAKFQPKENYNAPYSIELSLEKNKFTFKVRDAGGDNLPYLILSLSPYKHLIKDYFLMIDSYEQLRPHSMPTKLEAIDMARRGLHNEAAELMIERLKDKIEIDLDTARGLFTLICVLHIGDLKTGWA